MKSGQHGGHIERPLRALDARGLTLLGALFASWRLVLRISKEEPLNKQEDTP